jgi:competence protein ComEC
MLFFNLYLKSILTPKGTFIKLVATLFTLVALPYMDYHLCIALCCDVFVCNNGLSITTQCKCLSLLVSALLLLLFQPFLFDVGFQLSYLALFFFMCGFTLIEQLFAPKTKIVKYSWTLQYINSTNRDTSFKYLFFHQFPGLFFCD